MECDVYHSCGVMGGVVLPSAWIHETSCYQLEPNLML